MRTLTRNAARGRSSAKDPWQHTKTDFQRANILNIFQTWKNTNLGTVANLEVKAPAMNQIILLPPHQTHKGVKTSV
jgi:hypothetical protein